jgi:hypothetical protein
LRWLRLEGDGVPPGAAVRLRQSGDLLVPNNLPVTFRGASLVRAPERAAVRAVREVQLSTVVEAAKVEAVAYVAYAGLQAVANLTDVEARLIARSPLAERRLALIGDIGAGKIAEILERMRP